MKKSSILNLCFVLAMHSIAGQNINHDSLQKAALHEITVFHTAKEKKNTVQSAQSIDDYLAKQENIALIKRGAYAWEPMLNNMSMERTRQTIDGMQIFHACTDKMDPITAYVETNNLQSIDITSGSQGSTFGTTLGGSIDLKTRQLSFSEEQTISALAQSSYQSVNQQKAVGASIDYTSKRWIANGSAMFREAENYKAGGGEEILHSQFRKLNLSGKLGYAINDHHSLELSTIYDKATDVGYPALPMDVSLAEAIISAVTHKYVPTDGKIAEWSNKLYYNSITHHMDDTSRPDVAIRMDMPGKTSTYGLTSTVSATLKDNHHTSTTLNAYHNKSSATMTMFSEDPNHKDMFAFTWPNVNTNYLGFSVKDHWQIDRKQSFLFTVGLGAHVNTISQEGVNQLSIFHNDFTISRNKTRAVGNFAVNYERKTSEWRYGIGMGYGNRAPSVSEAYGYYLFNSSDKYDYIGNPALKNEKTFEGNSFIKFVSPAFTSKLSTSFFYLHDYIIGVVDPVFNAMTHGANGVKLYKNISHAKQGSVAWDFTYKFTQQWALAGGASYHYGKDSNSNTLPFISPLAYDGAITYSNNGLTSTMNVQGNAIKNNAAAFYGESKTPAYALVNWHTQYSCLVLKNVVTVGIGIENILDTNYTTYADWNHIPNPGRNFSFKVSAQF